jgi:hypothetical protein
MGLYKFVISNKKVGMEDDRRMDQVMDVMDNGT